MAASIYLDHNATTPMLPEVADALRQAALQYGANPASQHAAGRNARRALEDARERVGQLVGAQMSGSRPDRLVFTSGGTEANNLALLGLLRSGDSISTPVIVSSLEHPSVASAAARLNAAGARIVRLSAECDGRLSLDDLEPALALAPRLTSVMLANNETGVLQPVTELAAACRRRGVLVHTDAVQAVGKIAVDFRGLDVDALSLTAHKFHGPVGIGALVVRHGVDLKPTLAGGFQQSGIRPGTEPVALALAMCVALEAWRREAAARLERMTELRERFERRLIAGFAEAVVIGGQAPRLPHTSNIALVGIDRQTLALALDQEGVACSTGSACASGSSEPSPTLVAMGLPEEQIASSLRFSLGAATTQAEIDDAVERILSVCNRLRRG